MLDERTPEQKAQEAAAAAAALNKLLEQNKARAAEPNPLTTGASMSRAIDPLRPV